MSTVNDRRPSSLGTWAVVLVVAVALVVAWFALGGLGRSGAGAVPGASGSASAATAATSTATRTPSAGRPSGTASTATSARPTTSGASATDPANGLRWVSVETLPKQAGQTLTLIRAGGPFPYAKDGTVFGNNEGLLPRQARGYYHEFTVPTPGESDRGARRIVTGGPAYGVTNGEFYYTGDHYATFERIRP